MNDVGCGLTKVFCVLTGGFFIVTFFLSGLGIGFFFLGFGFVSVVSTAFCFLVTVLDSTVFSTSTSVGISFLGATFITDSLEAFLFL